MPKHRSTGAHKLLVQFLYGSYPFLTRMVRGYCVLTSVRKMARLLGTESKKVNIWINYLESTGYIDTVKYAPNRRSLKFKIRRPLYYDQ